MKAFKRFVAPLLLLAIPAHGQVPPTITPEALIDQEINPQVEQQRKGQYGPMERPVLEPLGLIQRAWDRAGPQAGHYRVPYDPMATPKLRVRLGMPLTIHLPAGERVVKEGLIIGSGLIEKRYAAGNKIVLEATAVGADTSVTVLGASGRTYPFYVRTEGPTSSNVPDLVVHFDGPPVTPMVPAEGFPLDPAGLPDLANPMTAARLNFGYTMAGDPTIAPDVVYSDGVFTYLRWSPERWKSTDLPSVYRVVDRVDEPIPPPEVVETTLVVKETGPLSLRSGKRYICIRPSGKQPSDRPVYARPVAAP